jgi:hypothetical protein
VVRLPAPRSSEGKADTTYKYSVVRLKADTTYKYRRDCDCSR